MGKEMTLPQMKSCEDLHPEMTESELVKGNEVIDGEEKLAEGKEAEALGVLEYKLNIPYPA